MSGPEPPEPPEPPVRRRRVQQRAIETRRLLLDTAIEVLLDSGYANLSTVRVSQRAGVSRGKQVHHFPTKVALVTAAIEHLAEEYETDLADRWRQGAGVAQADRVGTALDLLWDVHTRPLFRAALELIVGARTDPELRDALVEFERKTTATLRARAPELFGAEAHRPGFTESFYTALSAIRGLALAKVIYPGTEAEFATIWGKTRGRLRLLFGGSS